VTLVRSPERFDIRDLDALADWLAGQ